MRCTLLAVVSGLAVSTPAAADPRKDADRLVAEGKSLGESGQPRAALEKFRAAERVFPRPVHLCNIGIAYESLRNLPLALLYLERCRERASSFPRWLAEKQGEISAELARTHAPIEIHVDPSDAKIHLSVLGDDEPIESGEKVFLPRGTWAIEVRKSGYRRLRTTVRVRNLAGQRLDLTLERVETHDAAERAPPRRRSAVAPWIWIGSGAGAAGAGALFHWRSIEARDEARSLPAGMEFDERRAAYRRYGWLAAGAYAAGAVCVGVGVFLLVRRGAEPTGATDDEDVALGVAIGRGELLVSLSF